MGDEITQDEYDLQQEWLPRFAQQMRRRRKDDPKPAKIDVFEATLQRGDDDG